MAVIAKKSCKFKNPTKYFNPSKDASHVVIPSSNSWQFKNRKIEGYETRLYWQFKYCQDVGGQTFFYTLTYNDNSVPHHYGVNCFDYEDLRDLLTGGFRKKLLRKYGTKFKYFVGAELGDGKGSRGLANNPHYHILFFLEPDDSGRYDYVKIEPLQFRSLVREYWQGIDQGEDFVDFKSLKYGIAKEGDNVGLVSDFRACAYVAKYVTKDITLKRKESDIRRILFSRYRKDLKDSLEFNYDFLNEVVFPYYNLPKDSKGNWLFTKNEILSSCLPSLMEFFDRIPSIYEDDIFPENTLVTDVCLLCKKCDLWSSYYDFLNERLVELVDSGLTEWRNRFCNKCRVSQGVGDYALEYIKDIDNPTIEVPTKNGVKCRPLSLYYYRKLFYGVCRPKELTFNGKFVSHNPTRVLNRFGS